MKQLITSALPYVNNKLHLGHLIGCLLPSDVFARFCRAKGDEVLYICGADEHGTPVEVGAKKEGLSFEDYSEKYYQSQLKSIKDFNLSFNYFGRTHTPEQEKLVIDVFNHLEKNGFIEERIMLQPYCIDDKQFLADRYIEGICPKCGYEKARGDQCDKCGSLLDPKDLINPYSTISGSKNIELRETKHLFFLASKIQPKLKKWIDSKQDIWPKTALSIAYKWLKEGIKDQCITRDLKCGISVPKKGYENKTFYVWLDAPWGYISISEIYCKKNGLNYLDWWKNPEVNYTQFMGKDNVAFHAVFFPSAEIAVNNNWKMVDNLKAVNFLNFEGAKISKSTGNGIFLDDAIIEFPSDYWRYYLISNSPESDDTDFTIDRFTEVINKDLNGILGNFISRITKFTEKKLGNTIPENYSDTELEIELKNNINSCLSEITENMEKLELRKATAKIRELWTIGNEYITKSEPWSIIKTDENRAKTILYNCFNLIDLYARISSIIIPETADKIIKTFDKKLDVSWPKTFEYRIKSGEKFNITENLFERISPERNQELKDKYLIK